MSARFSAWFYQNSPEDNYCEKQLELPRFFCEDDQAELCDMCFLTQEDENHRVCGVQEAAVEYKKIFQELLTTMKEKLEGAKRLLAEEQGRMVVVKGEEQNFEKVVGSERRMMFRLVTGENETNFRKLQECIVNPNMKESRHAVNSWNLLQSQRGSFRKHDRT